MYFLLQLSTILIVTLWMVLQPSVAYAHVSEQAFVLLLPTNVYITAGVLVVILTITLLAFLPANWTHKLFTPKAILTHNAAELSKSRRLNAADLTSIASTLFLFIMLGVGFSGTHDPLKNILPLFIWTIWWIGFVVAQEVHTKFA